MKFTIKPIRYSATTEGGRQWAGYSIWVENCLVLGDSSATLPNSYTTDKVILMGLLDGLVRFIKRVKTHPLDVIEISVPASIRDTIGHGETLGKKTALSFTILTLIDVLIGTGAKVKFYTPEAGEK